MKRKRNNSIKGIRVKNVGFLNERADFDQWVSASKTRNFLIEDPILDYLNLYGKENGYLKDHERKYFNESLNFNKYIMEKGILFEDKIVSLLKELFNGEFIQISHNDKLDSLNTRLFDNTKDAIRNKIPLIIHPVFHDSSSKTFGVPDLLIRTDYLHKIINSVNNQEINSVNSQEINSQESSSVNDTQYIQKIRKMEKEQRQDYAIIDIKFTTLHFNKGNASNSSNSEFAHTLRNVSNTKAFKGQIAVYNKILEKLTDQCCRYAYILGRKSNITDNAFEKLGEIDFLGFDKSYYSLSQQAIDWYRKIKSDKSIKIYPNMSNTNDLPWHYAKKEIAKEMNEISQLLYIGPKIRDKLLKNGIDNLNELIIDDIDAVINLSDKRRNIIKKILKINKSNKNIYKKKYKPTFDPNSVFYIDFETVSDINDPLTELPKAGGISMIYMIGCGYIKDNKWHFKNFIVNCLDKSEETRIICEWLSFMKSVSNQSNEMNVNGMSVNEMNVNEIKVVHWGAIEKTLFDKLEITKEIQETQETFNESKEIKEMDTTFINLHKMVIETPIAIKGVYNYGLKTVAKNLYKLGLIKTNWGNSCVDGIGSIVASIKCNEIANEQNISMKDVPIMKEIEFYNEIDCRVMYEIANLLK